MFQINFPPNGFITSSDLPQLEQLLPPREEVIIPEDGEEVELVKIDPKEQARNRSQYGVSMERYFNSSNEIYK